VSEQTIVCVLGMHRSGTSLVARLLNVLGLDLGPEEHLMEPNESNPAGHWESLPVSEINEDIFLRLGGSWAVPPPMPPGWERGPELADLRRRARELIAADFSDSELWGFKDPRTCLTAPFWQRLLPPMRYVICLRNPVDVAASLEARKEEWVPLDQGFDLWFRYVRSTLSAAAGHPHEFIFYEDLMTDPEPVVGTLARFLGRSRPSQGQIREAIEVAVSESLWHHQTAAPNVIDADGLGFHIKALYGALRLFVPGAADAGIEVLDLLGAYADDAGAYVAELEGDRARLEGAYERSHALERELSALAAKLEERSAELGRVSSLHLDEQRLRRRLEAELKVVRAEFDRRHPEPIPGATPKAEESGARDRLAAQVQARARELIPAGATVLVAAKGDDALLRLDGSHGLHFPATADGRYVGHHPAGDTAAIAQLEAVRARGADHLIIPATTRWWLDHYEGLRRHLEDRYAPLLDDETCAIYRLTAADRGGAAGPITALRRIAASLRIRSGREPSILDWGTELGVGDQLPEMPVFVPPGDGPTLPYLDGTVDVVVLGSADPGRIAEARRVATGAVIRVDPSAPERCELEWSAADLGGWGHDVSVTLIPEGETRSWEASIASFAETLDAGFDGLLTVVGDPAKLAGAIDLAAAQGVRVLRVEAPDDASFAQRARAAVGAADQRFHVFVTAPAVPLPDWLPSMRALFSGDQGAGVVGTRTVLGDGTLAEAGGIVAADGTRDRRGGGDPDPDRPEYCHVQRVDFCSPPVLATSRDLYDRLSGFDDRRVAADEAVVDFSLRARQTKAPVYYQPQARIVAIGNGSR
jgi:Sulfotransferase family